MFDVIYVSQVHTKLMKVKFVMPKWKLHYGFHDRETVNSPSSTSIFSYTHVKHRFLFSRDN